MLRLIFFFMVLCRKLFGENNNVFFLTENRQILIQEGIGQRWDPVHSWDQIAHHDYALHFPSSYNNLDVTIFKSNRVHRGNY